MVKSIVRTAIIAIIVIIISVVLLYLFAMWSAHFQRCNGLLIDNNNALKEMQHNPTESNVAHQKQTRDNYMKECSMQ